MLNKIHLILLLSGFISLLYSQDYWQKLPAPKTGFSYQTTNRLFITPEDIIFIASDSGVLKSVDGGYSWVNIWKHDLDPIIYDNLVNFIYVSNTGSLYIGDHLFRDRFLQSNDGGTTWDSVFLPTPYPDGFGTGAYSITETTNSIFIGLMNSNAIIRSNDNGDSWDLVFGDTLYDFGDWNFLATDKNDKIYARKNYTTVSSDNGNSWDTLKVPQTDPSNNFSSIAGIYVSNNKEFYFITSSASILKMNDEGTELIEYAQVYIIPMVDMENFVWGKMA